MECMETGDSWDEWGLWRENKETLIMPLRVLMNYYTAHRAQGNCCLLLRSIYHHLRRFVTRARVWITWFLVLQASCVPESSLRTPHYMAALTINRKKQFKKSQDRWAVLLGFSFCLVPSREAFYWPSMKQHTCSWGFKPASKNRNGC